MPPSRPFRILSLDGGGSKGVYSLGVLREVEKVIAKPLYQHFDLIYGTSTGAIIAALIALGEPIGQIYDRYLSMVPSIMRPRTPAGRSRALRSHAVECFGDKGFDAFLTNIGIVATNFEYRRPIIFKNSPQQAYGRIETFVSGFGCTISEALVASCAAYPLFQKVSVVTQNQGHPIVIDGGFVANNPTLFAIADALQAFHIPKEELRVLSIGVGVYPEKPLTYQRIASLLLPIQIVEVTFASNTNTLEIIRSIMFRDIDVVRVNEAFADNIYRTNLLEHDKTKLQKLMVLGRESYAKQEDAIRAHLL